MEINLIKSIEVYSSKIDIIYEKGNDAGSFNWYEGWIKIGIKNIKRDPMYTLNIISHELMEMILVCVGARFNNSRTGDNYLFNFDHQTFENAINIHTQIILKFIK